MLPPATQIKIKKKVRLDNCHKRMVEEYFDKNNQGTVTLTQQFAHVSTLPVRASQI